MLEIKINGNFDYQAADLWSQTFVQEYGFDESIEKLRS